MPDINIYIVFAQVINFGLLLLLFHKLIGKKLSEQVELRREQLKKLQLAEEHYSEKMILAEKEKQELLDQAQNTSQNLMKESENLAQIKAEALMKEANTRVFAILEGGQREIEKERRSMLAQMKSHILDVSLRLNQKMFGSTQENKEFIEKEFERMK